MNKIGVLLISFFIFSCSTAKEIHVENIYWVNSSKSDCTGVALMSCLQVQKSKTLDGSKPWELFYSEIEGFDYRPGFIYKLLIKDEVIDNPAADASSIKYTLIEILEKKQDMRYAIHDIWMLEKIDGKIIELNEDDKRPQIEINVTKMLVFGTNGCNSISGSILSLNEVTIKFGLLRSTRKMCQSMEIPTLFSIRLGETKKYRKKGTHLILLNESSEEILIFKKSD